MFSCFSMANRATDVFFKNIFGAMHLKSVIYKNSKTFARFLLYDRLS
jgi:hypothetical protein